MKKNQKGAILYLTIIIMAVISAMAIGLNVFFISQIKMIKNISDSVKALCVANTGIEMLLRMNISEIQDIGNEGKINAENEFGEDYGYEAQVICCKVGVGDCKLVENPTTGIVCPNIDDGFVSDFEIDEDCEANYFCYKSTGNYKGIRRAIEVKR
ncbi:MAG: hypothetical protein U9Q27_01270 [Patescibacteria group bacterium]|nr:hypothetical protein [Patescibacteria group bacterium]